MPSLLDVVPGLAAYKPSMLVLGILVLTQLVQSFLTAPLAYASGEQVPGMPLRHGFSKFSFRSVRTYQNTTENTPAFALAVLVAIVLGVPASLTNGLSWLYLSFRLAFWAVYYAGIGKQAGGPRTLAYVGGLLTNIVLGGAAVLAGLFA